MVPGQDGTRLTGPGGRRRPALVTQYSLFGAAAALPALADLDGLLLAGGQWVRSGAAARLSVLVADQWRATRWPPRSSTLEVGGDDAVVTTPGGFGVRTAFSPELLEPAARWTRGARQGLPAGFALGPGGLRLWAIAAGHRDESGYLFTTAEPDDPIHRAAGAQLARLGVAALSLSRRAGGRGPGWRVTSARRLRRLVELLGPPPAGCGADWPSGLPSPTPTGRSVGNVTGRLPASCTVRDVGGLIGR